MCLIGFFGFLPKLIQLLRMYHDKTKGLVLLK